MEVFHAVMQEQSVSGAARRLSMTQPAVSNALRRLRETFGDELFIKVAGGVRPTAKAAAVWPDLRDALDTIQSLIAPPCFTPGNTTFAFHIALTETFISRVQPHLAQRFLSAAPAAVLNFHPHSNPASTQALERGSLDCAVGMFPTIPPDIHIEGLVSDEYVCVHRADNSELDQPLSLEAFIAARHVLVKQASWQAGLVDIWLSLQGLKRRITMVVNTSADALGVVSTTNLLVAMPRRFAEDAIRNNRLKIAELPFAKERVLYKLAWHERTDRDPARKWLRALIRTSIQETW